MLAQPWADGRTLEVIDKAIFDYASIAVEVSQCEVNDEASFWFS